MEKTVLAAFCGGLLLVLTACTATATTNVPSGEPTAPFSTAASVPNTTSSATPTTAPSTAPVTAKPTPTATHTTVPTSNAAYPFSSGDAIGSAPLAIRITTRAGTKDYPSSGTPYTVAACQVLYYSATYGHDGSTTVTKGNQQRLSENAIQQFLKGKNVTNVTTGTSTLATTTTVNGKPALIETESATYTAGKSVTTAHFRAFTNNEIIVYVQTCPKGAILNTDQNVRLITD